MNEDAPIAADPTPTEPPTKGSGKGSSKGPANPGGEENFPREDPTRRSAERNMREPSNVRPSNDPIPEKTPPSQGSADPPVEGG